MLVSTIVALALTVSGGLAGYTTILSNRLDREVERVERRIDRDAQALARRLETRVEEFKIALQRHSDLRWHQGAGEGIASLNEKVANFHGMKQDVADLKKAVFGMGADKP